MLIIVSDLGSLGELFLGLGVMPEATVARGPGEVLGY